VRDGLGRALVLVVANEQELARLDSIAGDGDHGMGMVRGLKAASVAATDAPDGAKAGAVLISAGRAFGRAAGGASGALIGTCMTTVGRSLREDDPDGPRLVAALADGLSAVCKLGGTQPGDKTMVDTLDPFVSALRLAVGAGEQVSVAWGRALDSARGGVAGTAQMASKRGRAARLGERSLGEPDAGAVSTLYLLESFGAALAARVSSGAS
jgi:dihydroxyacetone kinase